MTINPKRVTRLGTKKRSNIATSSQRAADSRRIKEALMGGFRKPRTAIVGDGNGNVDAVAISGAPNTIYFKYPSDVTDEQRWAYVDWAQNDERFVHGTVILVEPSHENPREMVVRGYDPLRTKFQHEVRPNFREPSAAFTHTFDFEVAHECWVPNNSATHYVPLNGWDVSSGDTLYVKKMGFESFILTSIQTVWQNAWASFPGAGGGVFIYDQDGTLLASEDAFPVAGVDLTIDNYEVTGIKVQAVRTGPGTETGLVDAYLSSITLTGIGINPFEDEVCPDTLPIASLTGTATASQLPTDIVYLASAQTLTSKTLTSPVVNTPDINGGTVDNVTTLTVVSSTAGTIPMPVMTETQRDAIVTPPEGAWVYNVTTDKPNYYDGADWVEVATAITPDATDVTYTPSDPSKWTDPDPVNLQEAVDDLRTELFDVQGLVDGGAPDNANYITGTASADLSGETVIPGLRGSADIAGAAGGGITEEYDTASSGLTWNSAPDTENSNTTVLSHLYVKTTGTTEHIGTRSWTPAGAFDARVKLALGSESVSATALGAGLHIGNSGDTSRLLIQLVRGSAGRIIRCYTYAGGAYTQRGSDVNTNKTGIYFRITRDGSNNVRYYFSDDGMAWQFIAAQSFTFTATNIGYRILNAEATVAEFYSDWLRTGV
jgi:hypothetical protein